MEKKQVRNEAKKYVLQSKLVIPSQIDLSDDSVDMVSSINFVDFELIQQDETPLPEAEIQMNAAPQPKRRRTQSFSVNNKMSRTAEDFMRTSKVSRARTYGSKAEKIKMSDTQQSNFSRQRVKFASDPKTIVTDEERQGKVVTVRQKEVLLVDDGGISI